MLRNIVSFVAATLIAAACSPSLLNAQCTEFTGSGELGYVSSSGNVDFIVAKACTGDGNVLQFDMGATGVCDVIYGPVGYSGKVTLSGYSVMQNSALAVSFRSSPTGTDSYTEQVTFTPVCGTVTLASAITAGQYLRICKTATSPRVRLDRACISGLQPLPVELVSFRAGVRDGQVVLSWKTATELNNYGFEIQRRTAASAHWDVAGFVEGSGTSAVEQQYSFSDPATLGTVTMYRLRQIDRDGSSEYSDEVMVAPATAAAGAVGVAPNPFSTSGYVTFDLKVPQTARVSVYDLAGRCVREVTGAEHLSAGSHVLPFSMQGLPAGQYVVAVYTPAGVRTARFSKLR